MGNKKKIFPSNKNNINNAADKINNGDIIIYPTDTLYSFGVDATSSEAVEKLNQPPQKIG